MELTNWKTVYKKESWGDKSFGIEIRVSVDRPLNENDERAMYKISDDVETAIMTETMRQDPEAQKIKEEEKAKLLECFGGADIYVEELPNGYCSRWCCTQRPWYRVITPKGGITLGWRKRVISIEWSPAVTSAKADELFPSEDVTKYERVIHAWGYEKAKQYIARILA